MKHTFSITIFPKRMPEDMSLTMMEFFQINQISMISQWFLSELVGKLSMLGFFNPKMQKIGPILVQFG